MMLKLILKIQILIESSVPVFKLNMYISLIHYFTLFYDINLVKLKMYKEKNEDPYYGDYNDDYEENLS